LEKAPSQALKTELLYIFCRENVSAMRAARAAVAHFMHARLAAAFFGWQAWVFRHQEAVGKLRGVGLRLQQPLLMGAWQAWRGFAVREGLLQVASASRVRP